uniref:Uncharacterized protein ycf35 n=1 Tax=Acrochaetium secundatum TaxID=209631 RepID=A0A4D6BM66_9FLOR|nr:hypothetical protein [Acrochaetium secundatum]QBX88328.1 hypothetical protein [Acrochaetium secundatum]
MSHLSKIKTKIKNKIVLQQSLKDLNILSNTSPDLQDIQIYSEDIKFKYNVLFKWEKNNYEFIADSNTWQEKNMLSSLLEKIQQQYAYNTIMKTSRGEGFQYIEQEILKDGSMRIILEKWL